MCFNILQIYPLILCRGYKQIHDNKKHNMNIINYNITITIQIFKDLVI